MRVHLALPPAYRVSRLFAGAVLLITSLSLTTQAAKYFGGHERLMGLVNICYVDFEANLPSWYSSLALLTAALLLTVIARGKGRSGDPQRNKWRLLAVIFFLLSLDEIAMLHEFSIDPIRDAFGLSGALSFAWVIPGALFVVGLGVYLLGFLRSLPRRTSTLFVAAGLLFVGGAIGVEMVSAAHASMHGEENFTYVLIVTLEEFLEMAGVVVFIHGLIDYGRREFGDQPILLMSDDHSPSADLPH